MAIQKTLIDSQENIVYPQTRASTVYTNDGTDLETKLMSLGGGDNETMQTIVNNTNILTLFPIRYYIYNTTTFKVPFDTYLTVRACGQGGAQSSGRYGGGGGGYVKDYRFYHKGDILNITFSNGKVTITEANTGLNLTANAGSSGSTSAAGVGGTASGGNLINATGGAGGASAAGKESTKGCGGGGGYSGSIGYAGGNGGFAGGNGFSATLVNGCTGGAGGTGGFFGGNGGQGTALDGSDKAAGAGGNSTYGIGGNGGYGEGDETGGIGGAGGSGFLAGGNGGNAGRGAKYNSYAGEYVYYNGTGGKGGDCTGSTLYGRGGVESNNQIQAENGSAAEGNPLNFSIPKRTNHGGGNGGIAACIITIGEDSIPC